MAITKKKSKPSAKKDANFTSEVEESVEVKTLMQDERTHKIAGSFCLLFAFLLFIAFTSYLFTWEEDQDKVFAEGYKLLLSSDSKMANLMGTFGAYISHFFIYKGFGVASYLFCSLFFILGINLFSGKKIFSISRNLKYLIVGLPLLSITASVIVGHTAFPWGGSVGNMGRQYLYSVIGSIGSIALLAVLFFAYIIWRFNPSLPSFSKKESEPLHETDEDEENEISSEQAESILVDKKGNSLNGNKELKLKEEPSFTNNLAVVEREEREEDEEELELPPSVVVQAPISMPEPVLTASPNLEATESLNDDSLELEIKSADADEVIPPVSAAEKVLQSAPYDPILDLKDYKKPTVDLLEQHGSEKIEHDPAELEANKNQIINTLKNYDISISKISATIGPTVTLYEIIPAAGVRISRIKNLEDDIALSLAALGIRIIAPIPGKGTIGIEVPNTKKTIVSMRTLLSSDKFLQNKFSLPIAIGKRIDNENFIVDLASMPHLLMAGATGQGKSVGLNAILVSLLYSKHPSQLKFVLVDPKKVELNVYKAIEKHFLAKLPGEEDSIITDTKKVVNTLNALCIEMDNRYDLLKEAGCRNIKEYNEKFAARKLNPEKGHQYLPFIVLVVDEFADLIMTAGKEVEMPIARLAQLARAIGIHLIIATQRPSVNIITGTIKANFPARIAFKVSSKIDSRTILDAGGADQLIGKGDMLINYNGEVVRLQCAFVDTPEVDRIVDFIGSQRGYTEAFLLPEYSDDADPEGKNFDVNDKDALFEEAARLIVSSQSGSTSLIQRRMKLGYNRAGRIMDQLESAGIVGPGQGSKPREVLYKTEHELVQYLDEFLN